MCRTAPDRIYFDPFYLLCYAIDMHSKKTAKEYCTTNTVYQEVEVDVWIGNLVQATGKILFMEELYRKLYTVSLTVSPPQSKAS